MDNSEHRKTGSGFGALSTTTDVLRGIDLSGRLAIVTGGSSGLGLIGASPTNGGWQTPEQGAATQVWAATSAQLTGAGGVYCEDCDIVEPAAPDTVLGSGVNTWATDPERAARLWALSAELTGVDAFAPQS